MTENAAVFAPTPRATIDDGGQREAARAVQRARGIAEILLQDVPMDGGGIQ